MIKPNQKEKWTMEIVLSQVNPSQLGLAVVCCGSPGSISVAAAREGLADQFCLSSLWDGEIARGGQAAGRAASLEEGPSL